MTYRRMLSLQNVHDYFEGSHFTHAFYMYIVYTVSMHAVCLVLFMQVNKILNFYLDKINYFFPVCNFIIAIILINWY